MQLKFSIREWEDGSVRKEFAAQARTYVWIPGRHVTIRQRSTSLVIPVHRHRQKKIPELSVKTAEPIGKVCFSVR